MESFFHTAQKLCQPASLQHPFIRCFLLIARPYFICHKRPKKKKRRVADRNEGILPNRGQSRTKTKAKLETTQTQTQLKGPTIWSRWGRGEGDKRNVKRRSAQSKQQKEINLHAVIKMYEKAEKNPFLPNTDQEKICTQKPFFHSSTQQHCAQLFQLSVGHPLKFDEIVARNVAQI